MSYQLSEIKQSGVEISSGAEDIINRYGHTVDMGPAPLAPDIPSIIIWACIAFMFLGGIFDSSGACIVTRPSYPKLAEVHHRQPVILNYNTLSDWFKKSHDYNCSFSEDIIIFPVSIKVNSSLNNCKDNVSKVE